MAVFVTRCSLGLRAAAGLILGVGLLMGAVPSSVLGTAELAPAVVVALDADPTGNSPRAVGAVEDCVSATAGQPVNIDVVLPSPGIPRDRGIAAFQFTIGYDPRIVWIGADDPSVLLAQAGGSKVVPIADPRPDRNGVYVSWGVDFGAAGVEPQGTSEAGPGVISRITLLPQAVGRSSLTLRDVILIDDASQTMKPESVQSATVVVGDQCPTKDQSTAPSGSATAPTTETATLPEEARSTPAVAAPSAGSFPIGGSAPPSSGLDPWSFIVGGLLASLGGSILIARSASLRLPVPGSRGWRFRPNSSDGGRQ